MNRRNGVQDFSLVQNKCNPFFLSFYLFWKVHLLGQTPGATDISSIAILPRLFLPTIPSKTIWKQLKKKGNPFHCRLMRHIWYFITLKGLDDATGAWAIYQLLPASPLSPQILRSGALPPIVRMKTLSSPMPEPNMWVQNLKKKNYCWSDVNTNYQDLQGDPNQIV